MSCQRFSTGNRNSPAMPTAPAMMIADVTLPKDSHAIGRIIAKPIAPAHQLGRFFPAMPSTVPNRLQLGIRREAELRTPKAHEYRTDEMEGVYHAG